MTAADRINLKAGAKKQVLDQFKFYFLLAILWLALNWVSEMISDRNVSGLQRILEGTDSLATSAGAMSFAGLLVIVSLMLRAGVQLTMVDLDRGTAQFDNPMQRGFKLFEDSHYFWGWVGISLLAGIFVFFWSWLLFIPGIIKTYSYSQAFYIYRDAYDQGHPITVLEAITRSRHMMDGNKGFLFVMDLSFILWFMLSGLFFGIPAIFVMPYYDQPRAKFYNQLVVRQAAQAGANSSLN